ncbi:MAG: SNF2-related protein [Panacagrimonas sp.]
MTAQVQGVRNPYLDFCIAVQAARRQAEGARSPIATACGVAASIYTHQIGNTMRVLTDVRIRHLLADEVGLGKTVQALMILNALRRQRPSLKVLVVVPDRLVTQWRDEILTRAHSAPVGEGSGEDSQYIRLAWEAQLKTGDWSLADIDARRYHVLVVDEMHKLTTEVQSRIVRVSEDIQHLLVLTATPAFQDVRRHAQLFSLLEPERTAAVRHLNREQRSQSIETVDTGPEITDEEAADIVRSMLDRDRMALEASSEAERTRTAMSECAYRRVIRTRRADFRGVLPARRHLPKVIEPLYVESERQALMWQYFEFLDDLSLKLDPVLLAKRVILSPPSLEQRVDFLRRRGHERQGLLEQVKPLVNKKAGDSRVDALVDLLNSIWLANPEERVLVAAQDNLTVDYLYETVGARLGEIGPLDARQKLVAARLRQGMMTDAVDDLAGVGNETSENLEAFQRGDAIVLFAPEAAQVGLNLQCARVLILYSVPWRPEEVEQWIGRLDRIGNEAAFSAEGAKSIDVYTIAQRGLVDEKVVRVLERFRVFEHSVNLDGKHLAEVTDAIEKAALHPEEVDWARFESETERMANEDSARDLSSPLQAHLPWTPAAAVALRARLEAVPPFQPILTELTPSIRSGLKAWDRAFEGMLKLLNRAGEYRIKTNGDEDGYRFKSLWYTYGEPGLQGQREVLSRVNFSFGPDPFLQKSPENAFCYVTRRGEIETPPRRTVQLVLEDKVVDRPLRFLGFGERLHDELIDGWVAFLDERVGGTIDIGFPTTHNFFTRVENPGVVIVRVTELNPVFALAPRLEERNSMEAVTAAITRSRVSELILPFISRTRCALEADSRWLITQLPPVFSVSGARKTPTGWETVAGEAISALLNPLLLDQSELASASVQSFNSDTERSAEAGSTFLREGDSLAAELAWAALIPSFRENAETRISVVSRERDDELSLRALEHRLASERARLAVERGNKLQIQRAESECAMAEDRLAMSRTYWDRRLAWLHRCAEAVLNLQPEERVVQIIRVRRVNPH